MYFEREKEHVHKWGGAERKGERESQAGSVSTGPDTGLDLMNHEIMT